MDAERGPGGRHLIRRISTEEIRPLRHRILRPGQTYEETLYPGDDLADTVHLGAFDGERLVGVQLPGVALALAGVVLLAGG